MLISKVHFFLVVRQYIIFDILLESLENDVRFNLINRSIDV